MRASRIVGELLVCLGVCLGVGGLCPTTSAVPPNDLCGAATPISGPGPWPVDLVGANRDGALCSCGRNTSGNLWPQNDVWYLYTAASSGTAVITTTTCTNLSRGIGASILTGCGGTEQVCVQNICSASTPLSILVTSQTTYLLRLNSYTLISSGTPQQGTATLNIAEFPAPANDSCTLPAAASAASSVPMSFAGATQQTQPTCGFSVSGQLVPSNDLWYFYTAGVNGTAQVTASACTNLSLGVGGAIYDSCGGTQLFCTQNICSGTLSFPISTGAVYLLRTGTYASSPTGSPQTGTAQLNITELLPPPNDACGTATEIVGSGDYAWDDRGTVVNGPLPPCSDVPAQAAQVDVWFGYTAASTGTATFDCGGPSFQVVLTAYDTCGGTVLACDPETSVSFPAASAKQNRNWLCLATTAGQRYVIRVARNAGATPGPATLRVREWTTPASDSCDTAPAVPVGASEWFNDGVCDRGPFEMFIADSTPCSMLPSAQRAGGHMWFTFTPTRTGAVVIDTNGSGYETMLKAYSDCNGTAIACSDDRTAPSPPVRFPPEYLQEAYMVVRGVEGVPFRIRVSTEYELGEYYKMVRLNITEQDPASNEDCSGAIVVQPGTTPYNSDYAYSDLGSIAGPCWGATDHDLWYVWTPTHAGTALVHTCYAANYLDVIENVMMIFTGSCSGPMIACSFERLDQTFPCPDALAGLNLGSVTPGLPYYIRLASRRESVGDGQLNIEFTPAPCFADFNGQNGVTVQDIYDYLSDWNSQITGGPVILASADFNSQNGVTVQDIYDFLSAWNTGCP